MCQSKDIKGRRQRQSILSYDGKEVLACILELPQIEGENKLNATWEKAGERCIKFCKQKIAPVCNREHFYVYKLVCRAKCEENKIIFSIKATLSDRTECRVLYESKKNFCIKIQ